ncbi:DUF763 domain-containing protein [Verrucomicrobiota bacterium]
MRRGGHADLPLHHGRVPRWLGERMTALGGAIVQAVAWHYGRDEVLRRLSDPFWFQALGCVLGMDWHSSGITTSVMGALKRAVNPLSRDIGLYICGGRGRHSRRTPEELTAIADHTGLDSAPLVRSSKLTAKVDNTAVQDGFQLYLHSFVLTADGNWAVIQQGMNGTRRMARRYHWLSSSLPSFVDTPHAAVVGENQGLILNLTHHDAEPTRNALAVMPREHPDRLMKEIRQVVLPRHHNVRETDVDLKRLGSVLAVAHDQGVGDFESLLLCRGLGPRTLQSLTLVSEVIHGTPSRFTDPARYAFAHGGKDGHPFPVPLKVYDESISVLKDAVGKARIGRTDKIRAVQCLDRFVRRAEQVADAGVDLQGLIEHEREIAPELGGRTVFDRPGKRGPEQLELGI